MIPLFFISIFLLCLSPVLQASINDTDTLTTSTSLSVDQTLISAGGLFELGFFNRGNPKRYYLGIWYKDIPTNDIIWVANRDSPSPKNSCTLHVSKTGNLTIFHLSDVLWSSNQSTATDPVLQLLDSGNLVVREAGDQDPNHYHWQSFNYPTDTLVPGQRLEYNPNLGSGRAFTSWRGLNDPGSGQFSFAAGNNSRLDFYLTGDHNEVLYQTPIVQDWTHDPIVKGVESSFFNYTYYYSPNEVYYILQQPPPPNARAKLRIMVTFDGLIREWLWDPNPNKTQWKLLWSTGSCGCGPYGVCSSNGKVCECPHGFEPADLEGWRAGNWSRGCSRTENLGCQSDKFLGLENVKVFDQNLTANYVNGSVGIEECREMCKRDCKCIAYANSQVLNQRGGSNNGCVTWTGNVTDVRNFTQGGQMLYIRVASSVLGNATWWTPLHILLLIVIPILILATILLAIGIWLCFYKGRTQIPNCMEALGRGETLRFGGHKIRQKLSKRGGYKMHTNWSNVRSRKSSRKTHNRNCCCFP